jgi:hypothetical protein
MFHTVEKARWWATIGRSIAQYGRRMSTVSSPTPFRHEARPDQAQNSHRIGFWHADLLLVALCRYHA